MPMRIAGLTARWATSGSMGTFRAKMSRRPPPGRSKSGRLPVAEQNGLVELAAGDPAGFMLPHAVRRRKGRFVDPSGVDARPPRPSAGSIRSTLKSTSTLPRSK